MAEKQGKLGDNWNDYANRLVQHLGWQHIGDKNMDLKGSEGEEYGIDSILKYKIPGHDVLQTVLLESKRYSKDSISSGTLTKWLKRLKEKLDGLRNSEELIKEFPELDDCSPTNLGIVMLWVHDANEEYLDDTFQRYLESTIINTGAKPGAYSRIMVLDNRRIVQLCVIIDVLQKYDDFNFVYPSGIIDNVAVEKSKVLTIEYMMSNIIIAECTKKGKSSSVVFYLGKMSESSMTLLIQFLNIYQRIDANHPLVIYHYDNSDSVLDVVNSYKNKKGFKDIVDFKTLAHYAINSEPQTIANDE